MKKFFSVFICILIGFYSFGLVACSSKNISTIQASKISSNIDEYDTPDNETNENDEYNVNTGSNNSSAFWMQYGGALIGGGCSILGGIAGALITVLVARKIDNKKQKYAYFHQYYKLLFNFKLDIEDKKDVFNLGHFKDCIDNFINKFNNDPDLFFYIYNVYYGSEYEKFETMLNGYCIQFSQESKSGDDLFTVLQEAVDNEMNNISKILKGNSNDDSDSK